MSRFHYILSLTALFAGSAFSAQPCLYIHGSCLKLNNHLEQTVKIECNSCYSVDAQANAEGSTQLDLGFGDGLGSPDPRQLYCSIKLDQGTDIKTFNFYNPYWGPIIEFDLHSAKQLDIKIADGWSSRKTDYHFDW
ncbi:hypothetical protein [Legionella jordanis]|uniref:Uncharacterized protein n=1 Tax=Legionella jordanis TaxID=456 RepID=A0A0W0VFS8_9GAMM|nr:hypothetical protein [Legionella jordanis]KTD18938.1 hypothetical protein Ljor_0161 [Legionella jordanis]RMX05498.1 hypothetical protein EAW55_02265 [Legionella jordanis]RMX19183.1 hypothetical protein EAS68_07030 [Legionella jordanis]VEH13038.1 Uncharacterised protein [Legionella jordanis]